MSNFQGIFEKREQSFISASIYMDLPLIKALKVLVPVTRISEIVKLAEMK